MKNLKRVIIENNKLPSFSVETGQYVIWENRDSVAHQLNSDVTINDFQFDVGIIFPEESSSPVFFNVKSPLEGFKYGCGLVPNLSAVVNVGSPLQEPEHGHDHGQDHEHGNHDHLKYFHALQEPEHGQDHGQDHGPDHGHGNHDHLKHFHGFVTGGRTGDRIYMTHTPIFSDERHHFQIILQASFAEENHLQRYNELRSSPYGHGKVQLFFDHLAMIDIQSGAVTELTAHSLRYYPDVPTVRPGLVFPSVATPIPEFAGAKIKIEKILHFRIFEPDMDYPESLTYLMYGNEEDVFIDHFISRAPNFHSVAKLVAPPSFWTKEYYDKTLKIQIPSRKLIDVSPKTIKRIAFLDNVTHLIWGLPSGTTSPVNPANSSPDPLRREPLNENGNRLFEVVPESGEKSVIEISHLLHFDAVRLLNDGLGF